MNLTANHPTLYGVDKYLGDLRHLQKMGTIISIEVDISNHVSISDNLLSFIQGVSGFYYLAGDIFIDFQHCRLQDVEVLLQTILMESGDLDLIDQMVVHMRTRIAGRPLHYDVSLTTESRLPKILSIEDRSLYFQFLTSFHLIWETSGQKV